MAFRGVVKTLALCAAGLWTASPAWAQTAPAPTPVSTAEPDPGMWAFDGELNGQPGRSLQIDTQLGRTMIVSYLGYRANGSALFLQASGVRGANDTAFTAPLQEFRNGRTTGGGAGNGELAGTLGDIRLTFDTPTTGTVTLPGDVPRRISRYSYGNAFWRDSTDSTVVSATPSPFDGSLTPTSYRIQLKGGNLQMNQLTTSQGRLCSYAGAYTVRGALLESEGTATCTDANGAQQRSPYRMERFAVDSLGMFSGTVLQGDAKTHFMGPCLPGAVFTGSPGTCAPFGNPLAVIVQPGMWAFDDEMDGRPGRSLQIDTRNGPSPIIVSYLGYRPDGSAVFMQGSASERVPGSVRYAMPLREFRNGPVIGGNPAQGGEVASTVGEIQLEFDSPTTGTVTLPFEAPRRISRFRYEDHAARFDKAYSATIYPVWRASGTTASLDIVARNNVFRMDTRSADGTYCEYRGTYRLAGDGLASDGTRTCTPLSGTGAGNTVEPYSVEQFSVDRNGVLRGSMRVSGNRFLYMGSCGTSYYCSGPGLDLPR